MRVVYAIPCRSIEQVTDGTVVLTGVEGNVKIVPSVPAAVLVPILVKIGAQHIEAGAGIKHHFTMSVLDPNLDAVGAPMEIEFEMTPGPHTPAGWEVTVNLPLAARFDAHASGNYSLELAVDGTTPMSVPIIVKTP